MTRRDAARVIDERRDRRRAESVVDVHHRHARTRSCSACRAAPRCRRSWRRSRCWSARRSPARSPGRRRRSAARPSMPATTMMTRAALRRSRSPSRRCRPATPTSYSRVTWLPITSAVTRRLFGDRQVGRARRAATMIVPLPGAMSCCRSVIRPRVGVIRRARHRLAHRRRTPRRRPASPAASSRGRRSARRSRRSGPASCPGRESLPEIPGAPSDGDRRGRTPDPRTAARGARRAARPSRRPAPTVPAAT